MSRQKIQPPEGMATLGSCTLFAGLPENETAMIVDRTETFAVPRGRLIMMSGDLTTDTYFLLSGSVIGQVIAQSGREILFTQIARGGYFGELAALDGQARSITISAQEECVLAKLRKDEFLELLKRFPQVAINLARDLAGQLRHMNERVFGLIMHDVETRVRIRLMQMAQAQEQLVQGGMITGLPTHEALAGYIGANREAVSRAMARLNKAGVIASGRKKAEITDLEGLLAPLDQDGA